MKSIFPMKIIKIKFNRIKVSVLKIKIIKKGKVILEMNVIY
jgi:hypothetical protein